VIPEIILLLESQIATSRSTDEDSSSNKSTVTEESDQDLDPRICGEEKEKAHCTGATPFTDIHDDPQKKQQSSTASNGRRKYQRIHSTPLKLIDFTTFENRAHHQSRARWRSKSRITSSGWQRSSIDLDPELDADSKRASHDINFMANQMRRAYSRSHTYDNLPIKFTRRGNSYTSNTRVSESRSLSISRSLSNPLKSLSNISIDNPVSNIQYDRTVIEQYLPDSDITFYEFFSTLMIQFCRLHHRSLFTILYSTKYDLFLDLLCTPDFDINTDDGYVSPLLLAVEQEDLELVELLLSFEHININIQKPSNHWTPLIIASNLNNLLIVRTLLKYSDINLHQTDIIGYNAFMYALKSPYQAALPCPDSSTHDDDSMTDGLFGMGISPHLEALQQEKVTNTSNDLLLLLFEHMDATLPHLSSTIINSRDDCDISLLTHAVLENNIEIVQVLLQYPQIDNSTVCFLHRTPLMCACDEKNPEMVALLLQSFPDDIDCQDIFGWTALMFASQNNDVETVEMLVHSYPYILYDLKNHDGCTASSLTTNSRIKSLFVS
jgi:ankyrin repeat protein